MLFFGGSLGCEGKKVWRPPICLPRVSLLSQTVSMYLNEYCRLCVEGNCTSLSVNTTIPPQIQVFLYANGQSLNMLSQRTFTPKRTPHKRFLPVCRRIPRLPNGATQKRNPATSWTQNANIFVIQWNLNYRDLSNAELRLSGLVGLVAKIKPLCFLLNILLFNYVFRT